jgi:hypothetical protein
MITCMGLFKKKEKVPEIPLVSSLSNIPTEGNSSNAEEYDVPELPSIPSSSKNEGLNQEIVKSAISDSFSPKENEVIEKGEANEVSPSPVSEGPKVVGNPMIPGRSSIMEGSTSGAIPQAPKKVLVKAPPVYKPKIQPKTIQQKPVVPHFNVPVTSKSCLDAEPVFIRIDKFQLAKKNIEQMKTKIKDIESIIGKVNQVKLKEEEEIRGWLGEVEKLKARLSEVDSDVFSQI